MNKEDTGIDLNNFDKNAEIAKFAGLRVPGWKLAVRLYIAPQTKNGMLIPDIRHSEQQYENCAGLIVGMGKGAYKDARYEHTGPWCQIGDWVCFPRHSGVRLVYDGIPLFVIQEDAILGCIDDPSIVSR